MDVCMYDFFYYEFLDFVIKALMGKTTSERNSR